MKIQRHMVENLKKVCICRSISMGTIIKAIEEGCLSFASLKRRIRVGTGNCKAKRCRQKIEGKLQEYKESLKSETVLK